MDKDEKNFMDLVPERISDLRKAADLTQEELAQKSGLTKAFIGMIERGKHTNLTLQSIHAIAEALKVHPTVILYGTDLAYKPETTKEFIDPNNPLDVTQFMKSIEELLPLAPDEREFILDLRTITEKGARRAVKEIIQSFSKRKK